MATDTAEQMTASIKARLTQFDFVDAAYTEALIYAIATEFKSQVGKMTVTTTSGAPDGEHTGVVS